MITLNRHAATVIYLLFPYQVTQLLNLLRVLYKDIVELSYEGLYSLLTQNLLKKIYKNEIA